MKQAIWFALLAVSGLVITGAQLDRQARMDPGVASTVPAPFRAFAQERIAASALAGNDRQGALREARKLVEQRPVPAEHLRVLGLAQLLDDQRQAGLTTLQLAGQRGWRDQIVQETMLRLAIEENDSAEAARRFAALIARPNTSDEVLIELGSAALQSGEAQSVFASILTPSQRWHATFLRRGIESLPAPTLANVIRLAQERGAVFDCDQLSYVEQAIRLSDLDNGDQSRTASFEIC